MQRKILIIEDDPVWQSRLQDLCEEVLDKFHTDAELQEHYMNRLYGPDIDYAVTKTADLNQAIALLTTEPAPEQFSLITVDINLSDSTLGTAEGLNLLENLQQVSDINAIIVSGETAIDYAIAGLKKYRVFDFVRKGRFNTGQFKKLVEIALLYDDATRLLDSWQWQDAQVAPLLAQRIKEIEQTLDSIPLYKRDIQAEFDKRVHHSTGIPDAEWSSRRLKTLLNQSDWVLLSISVKGFEEFATLHRGAQHAAEFLRFMTNNVLSAALQAKGNPDDFVGHTGDGFILITTPDKAEALQTEIAQRFSEQIRLAYDFEDAERGYMLVTVGDEVQKIPFISLIISQVSDRDGPFSYTLQVMELAAERKRAEAN